MIQIQVNVKDTAAPTLAALISSLTGAESADLNAIGGRAASNAAGKYHREFDKAGGWRGKRYLGTGRGDGSSFGADVARGWNHTAADATSATITNDATYYAHKVKGGTITPKRAKALTIPLIPEARGLYASVYQQNTGRRLFTIKGKHALFERIGSITSGSRGRRGAAGGTSIKTSQIRAVYALVKSVTNGPWPGALPPEEMLAVAFTNAWRDGLADIIEDS
jgi:ribosomal protein S10